MAFVEVNSARIHYRFDGAGDLPILVLSNSLGTDHTMWDGQMSDFAQHFRVLRYDTRGHGASAVIQGPYSIEQLGRDVVALLDELSIARAHFCGLSMGGMIGMWLGVNAPERLDKLVLCNTAARIGPPEMWNTRIDTVGKGGMAAIVDAVLERWFTAAFRQQAPAALERVRQTFLKTPPDGYAACCAAVRDMDQRAAIARIGLPTLVIAGTQDQATPPADGRFLAETIPGARYVEFDAAHLSNVEVGERFTAEVTNFLGQ